VVDARDVAGFAEFQDESELAPEFRSMTPAMNQNFTYGLVLGIVVAALISVNRGQDAGVKTRDDFIWVAGRKLPWTVLVFTLLSSWIGAGSCSAGAGERV